MSSNQWFILAYCVFMVVVPPIAFLVIRGTVAERLLERCWQVVLTPIRALFRKMRWD